MTRRFEFIAGNSAKFWSVTQDGPQVTVHYGRLGTVGQTQTKSFDADSKARLHAGKLIASKVAKGYTECMA